MQTAKQILIPERLRVVVTLAQLLERLEVGVQSRGADQYQSVVRHQVDELGRLATDEALGFVLDNFPATAELYENLHYHQAGLCRCPLEAALNAEVQARVAIERASRLDLA